MHGGRWSGLQLRYFPPWCLGALRWGSSSPMPGGMELVGSGWKWSNHQPVSQLVATQPSCLLVKLVGNNFDSKPRHGIHIQGNKFMRFPAEWLQSCMELVGSEFKKPAGQSVSCESSFTPCVIFNARPDFQVQSFCELSSRERRCETGWKWFCVESVERVERVEIGSGAAVSHLNQPFLLVMLVRKGFDSKTDFVISFSDLST